MPQVKEKLGEARRGDGVLLVVQNNEARSLTINGANGTISNLLGYAEGDLLNHTLDEVLGERTLTMLREELEFVDEAPDFGDIFSRQPNLRMRHRLGQEFILPGTVMRVLAQERHAQFQLVLPDEREKLEKQQLRDFLKTNLEGSQTPDPKTNLPDRATTERYLDLLNNYLPTKGMEASFAVLRMDRHERSLARYGEDGCRQLLQHVANICRSTFRNEDMVSALSDATLGLVLFDISRESARMVFNRLRWNVRNHRLAFGDKADFSITISIAFDMIGELSGADLMVRAETAIDGLDTDERNSLIELGI